MKTFFKILIITILFSFNGFAQDHRFEVSEVAMSVKTKGKWSDFTEFKEAKIVAKFIPNKDRIIIYSEIEQYYKILDYKDKQVIDGKEILVFNCVDQDLVSCIIEIHTRKEVNMSQLYVNYPDRILVYNMKHVK